MRACQLPIRKLDSIDMGDFNKDSAVMSYSIVVPTLNGGLAWKNSALAISKQTPSPLRVLTIDSGSSDGTVEVARSNGFDIRRIEVESFDHGGTRQLGVKNTKDAKVIVFLTQDAVLLSSSAVGNLLQAFEDPAVGAAYGRQIPSLEASPFERHSRGFNYPEQSMIKSRDSIAALGIRTAFCSNSFAAYRRSALEAVGGFPERTLFAEDMLVAAKMILNGFKVAYVAEAECEHWHDYSLLQEFRRAFDIGAFHSKERWILDKFGSAKQEGSSFVVSGLKQIGAQNAFALPKVILKYFAKASGYATGRLERYLPLAAKRFCSLNRAYWKTSA